jgi:hypothetical protein
MAVDPDHVWQLVLLTDGVISCCLCGVCQCSTEELADLTDTDFPKWCVVAPEWFRSLGWRLEPGELFYCPACATRTSELPPLPPWVLRDVRWRFGTPPIPDPTEFSEQVRRYQIESTGNDTWRPAACVIPHPRVRVGYMAPEGGERVDRSVDLECDNGRWFTASELLFKLHNAITESLRGADHCFFEGLGLHEPTRGLEVPVYGLWQGS